MTSNMIEIVGEFIHVNNLLQDGDKVVVGVSGGADSTALLLVLYKLGYDVQVVHCNFHLRGEESDRDQKFVTELCDSLGVTLRVCHYDTKSYAQEHGISVEMAARELRYNDFDLIMRECGASAICIAHHQDDSVETVMLNLIRGTGLRGLTGIKPKNGSIVRPMLCVTRTGIEQWLQDIGQPFVTDSTNFECDYTRNKIRNQVLPLLRTINSHFDESLFRTSDNLNHAYSFYKNAIERAKEEIVIHEEYGLCIFIDKLKQLPSAQAFLFELLTPLGFNSTQIVEITKAMDSKPGTEFYSETHHVIRSMDAFLVLVNRSAISDDVYIAIREEGTYELQNGDLLELKTKPAWRNPVSKDPMVATFDLDMFDSLAGTEISIRKWRDGDWFIPFGMNGRKLVSDFLTDSKINPAYRENQLVVTYEDDIIWVLGMRSDNRYRVTSNTRRQLILTLLKQ